MCKHACAGQEKWYITVKKPHFYNTSLIAIMICNGLIPDYLFHCASLLDKSLKTNKINWKQN